MDEKWFKSRQRKLGVTADQIADLIGRDRSAVSKIYAGQQRMTIEWAEAFARALGTSVDEVLQRAGTIEPTAAISTQFTQPIRSARSGFLEPDATPYAIKDHKTTSIAEALGAGNGRDVWTVTGNNLQLDGILAGDHIIVDTNASEMCRAGDTVIAQVYNHNNGTAATILRRYQPPVLISASADPASRSVHVVDGVNVVIRGRVIATWRTIAQ